LTALKFPGPSALKIGFLKNIQQVICQLQMQLIHLLSNTHSHGTGVCKVMQMVNNHFVKIDFRTDKVKRAEGGNKNTPLCQRLPFFLGTVL